MRDSKLIKIIAAGLSSIFVAEPAASQIYKYHELVETPKKFQLPDGLNKQCKKLVGQSEVEPLYVRGYLDGVSGACGPRCYEGLLSGRFDYVELQINNSESVDRVTPFKFAPANGRYRLIKRPYGHTSCRLFDQMVRMYSEQRKPVVQVDSNDALHKKNHNHLAKSCIGYDKVKSFSSEYGIRKVISPKLAYHPSRKYVAIKGEEIYRLGIQSVYAGKKKAEFSIGQQNGSAKIICWPKDSQVPLIEMFKSYRDAK